MKKYAVIVAAGSGTRMGKEIPKQFLTIAGKPILYHTLEVFLGTFDDLQLITVLPPRFMQWGRDMIQSLSGNDRISLVEGGSTRFQSVKNGLMLVKEPSVVFVHDGVRCLVTGQLIRHCYEQAVARGNAVPAVASTETLRIIEGENNRTINRKMVRMIQTPQTFLSPMLLKAYDCAEQDLFTDEATVVEACGEKIHLIEGEYTNIKITRPQDLAIAEQILRLRGANN